MYQKKKDLVEAAKALVDDPLWLESCPFVDVNTARKCNVCMLRLPDTYEHCPARKLNDAVAHFRT